MCEFKTIGATWWRREDGAQGGGVGVMRSMPVVRRGHGWCWWTTNLRPAAWTARLTSGGGDTVAGGAALKFFLAGSTVSVVWAWVYDVLGVWFDGFGWVFDLWASGYCVDSQPSTKGDGGFCDGFCLCGDIGRGDCFGGGFSGGSSGGGTDFVR